MPLGRYQDIRHYGLLASGVKADNLARARKLLDVAAPKPERFRSGHAPQLVPVLRLGHAHHRGVQGRPISATQADRDARRHQDRHLMSLPNLFRRCCTDLYRWPRAGRDSARPSLCPAKPRYASRSCFRATQASLPSPRSSTIAPGLVVIPIYTRSALRHKLIRV